MWNDRKALENKDQTRWRNGGEAIFSRVYNSPLGAYMHEKAGCRKVFYDKPEKIDPQKHKSCGCPAMRHPQRDSTASFLHTLFLITAL